MNMTFFTVKSVVTYLLVVFVLFLPACTDAEEPLFPTALKGTWEERYDFEYQDRQLVQVESFTFYDNGAYEQWMGYRELGSVALLGYRYYREGAYRMERDRLFSLESKSLLHQGEIIYGDLNQLNPLNPKPESWADLVLNENGKILDMYLPCNPYSSPRCIPKKTYTKLMIAFSGALHASWIESANLQGIAK